MRRCVCDVCVCVCVMCEGLFPVGRGGYIRYSRLSTSRTLQFWTPTKFIQPGCQSCKSPLIQYDAM